jgi:hypothetical protein
MKYVPCPRYTINSTRNAATDLRPLDAGDDEGESEIPIGVKIPSLIPAPDKLRLLLATTEFFVLYDWFASLRLCTPIILLLI